MIIWRRAEVGAGYDGRYPGGYGNWWRQFPGGGGKSLWRLGVIRHLVYSGHGGQPGIDGCYCSQVAKRHGENHTGIFLSPFNTKGHEKYDHDEIGIETGLCLIAQNALAADE